MKIGLASSQFINNDIVFNIKQIKKAIKKAKGVDMLCFGEAFLQGFDCLCWDYNIDKTIAISQDSPAILHIKKLSKQYNIDLTLGYIEKEKDAIYSSYIIIIDGAIAYNYRRIS